MTPPPQHRPASRAELARRFRTPRPLIGMVHLLPLPGSPQARGIDEVIARAEEDARALVHGGADGVLVENFGDTPFHPRAVPPETVASLTLAVSAVARIARREPDSPIPVGVNVLRNDARSALAIAAATRADFIRINVHVGSMYTDQGRLEGRAHQTLRTRHHLAPHVLLAADVHVKHATPPANADLGATARDTRERGLADVLIASGNATGNAPDLEAIERIRLAAPEAPLWIGSGLTPELVPRFFPTKADVQGPPGGAADGAIVGSALHRDGVLGRGVDVERVREMAAVMRAR